MQEEQFSSWINEKLAVRINSTRDICSVMGRTDLFEDTGLVSSCKQHFACWSPEHFKLEATLTNAIRAVEFRTANDSVEASVSSAK